MNVTDIAKVLFNNLRGPGGECVMSRKIVLQAAGAIHDALGKPPTLYPLSDCSIEVGRLRAKVYELQCQLKDGK